MEKIYKSSTKGELIPTVIIQFNNGYPDLWMTKEQYIEEGSFKGLLKSMCISIRDIVKVHHLLKTAKSYPSNEWMS